MISGAISILVNLLLCLLLSQRLDVAGLSIATAASSTVSAVLLLIPMMRKYPGALDRGFWIAILKMAACTAGMAAAVWGTGQCLKLWLADGGFHGSCWWGCRHWWALAVYFLLAAAAAAR